MTTTTTKTRNYIQSKMTNNRGKRNNKNYYSGNQQMSTSMYAIFNWGQTNNSRCDTRPKRYSLALAGSEINIDDPPNGDSKMCKRGENRFHLVNVFENVSL